MAQSTKSRTRSAASRNGSQAKSSSSRTGATRKRASTRRSSSSGNRAKSTANRRGSQSRTPSRNGIESIRDAAIDRTKAAGSAVAGAASRAKTPLIAGGTALAGAAVGAAVKDRLNSGGSKHPLKRIRGSSLGKPGAALRRVDLDTVKSVADRMSAYGRQASDVAEAVEKTRKKNG
jgi:hypothetical protein